MNLINDVSVIDYYTADTTVITADNQIITADSSGTYYYTADTTIITADSTIITADSTQEHKKSTYIFSIIPRDYFEEENLKIFLFEYFKSSFIDANFHYFFEKPFVWVMIKDVILEEDSIFQFEIRDGYNHIYKGNAIYTKRDLQTFEFEFLRKRKIDWKKLKITENEKI